jgi:rare lipoprotein A
MHDGGRDVHGSRGQDGARLRTAGRGLAAILVGLLVANCSSPKVTGGRASGKNYGVKASPRVIPEGQPIPKGGGREMVGKPYVVGGQTYVPSPARGYDREGWASWYGTAFHGRLTANGEIFDRESIAAAHPTLPLPSYVRVTNLVNQRSMVVRVNDRGPYEKQRLVDVSERVAEALDFRRKGTTRVRLQYLGKASVNGSDDNKLLATLRIDGSPAPFGRTSSPTMLANLREPEPPRAEAPVRAPVRMAELASPAPRPADRFEEEEPETAAAQPIARGPVRVAERPVETRRAPPDSEDDGPVTVVQAPAVVDLRRPMPADDRAPLRAAAPTRFVESSPVPPRRPGASSPAIVPQLTRGPLVEHLPPQRPALAGIY